MPVRTSAHPARATVTDVAPGVRFVEGPASNWTILTGPSGVSLIDAGYPDDLPLVLETLDDAAPGLPLETIAITHGHSDHTGGVRGLLERWPDARVIAAADELPNIRREVTWQVGVGQILPHLWKPRFAAWVRHAIRAGGLRDVAIPDPAAWTAGEPLTLSGHEVVPEPTPGHTPGHSAYRLPAAHAIATGDALVTGHRVLTREGPQPIHPMFHHDVDRALETFARGNARWRGLSILPGHGPVLIRGS